MYNPIKPWSSRLVEFAFAALLAVLMLRWAWALLRPLVPVLAVIGIVAALAGLVSTYLTRRRGHW